MTLRHLHYTIKNLLTIFTAITVLFILKSTAHAAIIEKQYERTYEVKNEFVSVNETKKINITDPNWLIPAGSKEYFTVFYPAEEDPLAADKIAKTKESLKVTGQNGQPLSYTFEESLNKNVVIAVTIPDVITSVLPTSITLQYDAYGLFVRNGQVYDIYIPGFPEDYEAVTERTSETIATSVIIPSSLPKVNFVNPKSEVTESNSGQVVTIPLENLRGKTNWIQLGNIQYYDFSISQTVPKTSSLPLALNFFTLPVPRDISSGSIDQKVYFTEIVPQPYSVEKDIDGNILVTFRLNAHEDSLISVKGVGVVTQDSSYSFANAGSISQIPLAMQDYIKDAPYWEVSDPAIQLTANEIKQGSSDVATIVNNTYQYVVGKIDYSYVKKYGLNQRQGALATLRGGAAVCMEYSDLFITLLRAQGIPARAVFGHGFNALDYESVNENTINHQWAEVYIPSQNEWVSIDTTWGEFGSDLVTGDLSHFISHVASVDPETPSTTKITFIGSLPFLSEIDYVVDVKPDTLDIPNVISAATTPDDLLDSYPKKEGFEEAVDTLTFNIAVVANHVGLQVSNALGLSSAQAGLLVIGITFAVISLILIFIITRSKRKSTIVQRSALYVDQNPTFT